MGQSAIHYPELLEADHAAVAVGVDGFDRALRAEASCGRRYAFAHGRTRGVLEVVEFDRDVLLLLNHCIDYPANEMTQLIGDGGWMHLQFRLSGAGMETLGSNEGWIETPDDTCVITSYPDGTLVDRKCLARKVQKTACLYMRPAMMEKFFRVPPTALPAPLRWIVDGAEKGPRVHNSPLQGAARAAVHDMMACSFHSHARTAFMRAKSMELVAIMLAALNDGPEPERQIRISEHDARRIVAARDIMHARRSESLTLDELAAHVGLNRSRLAAGFKELFGVGVQTYWRNLRLALARDMLRAEDLTITKAAERLGYSDISSFTRAFTAQYGVSPKEMRSNAGGAVVALEKDTSLYQAASRPDTTPPRHK